MSTECTVSLFDRFPELQVLGVVRLQGLTQIPPQLVPERRQWMQAERVGPDIQETRQHEQTDVGQDQPGVPRRANLPHRKMSELATQPLDPPIEVSMRHPKMTCRIGSRRHARTKISGPDLAVLEAVGRDVEAVVREVPGTRSAYAERVMGGNYLNFSVRRDEIARYGLTVGDVQDAIQSVIGGMNITTAVEGLERYPVNLRYSRDLRDNPRRCGTSWSGRRRASRSRSATSPPCRSSRDRRPSRAS